MATNKTNPETVEAVESIEPTELEQEQETEAEEEDLLADMPTLVEPTKLRIKHQNSLRRLSLAVAPAFERLRGLRDEDGVLSAEDMDAESYEGIFLATEMIDAFAESIAKDPEAYADWAAGKDANTFFAILSRYTRASGE